MGRKLLRGIGVGWKINGKYRKRGTAADGLL
jgi:hypothetical protein